MLGLLREGWRRGFVFFAIDLVGFIVAVIAAVRLHEIFAFVFEGFGLGPTASAIAGGLVIFVPIIVLVALVGGRVSKGVYKPGLWMTNRVLGAATGAALGLALVVVGLIALRASPIPLLPGVVDRSPLAQQVITGAAPVVAAVDDYLGLGLCEGRLKRRVPEVCSR